MRLHLHLILDSGGRVTIEGNDLSAEDVNEVFRALAGHQVQSPSIEEFRAAVRSGAYTTDVPDPEKAKQT